MKAKEAVGRLLNSVLRPLGMEIRGTRGPARHTLRGTLEQAKRLGFEPRTAIDVGAGIGMFCVVFSELASGDSRYPFSTGLCRGHIPDEDI